MNTVFEILNKVYDDAEKTAKTLFEKGLGERELSEPALKREFSAL